MAINPGDFLVGITPSSGNLIQCVLGHEVSFDIIFANLSFTDPLYNLNVNLSLPDGFTFVNSSISESSNTIDSAYKNIISFVNIKDLYPRENSFKFTVTISCEDTYRSNDLPIDFNTIIPGISVSASCDTKPRGSFNPDNQSITGTAISSGEVLRFKLSIVYPGTYLKGAGSSGSSASDATEPFPIKLTLTNNTKESSIVDLNCDLANGIRYLEEWTPTGPDSPNLSNPTVAIPVPGSGSGNNNVNISLDDIELSAGSVNEIEFDCAIWDKLTLNGVENSGSTIAHNDELSSNISISDDNYFYDESMLSKALEIELTKSADSNFTDVNAITAFSILYKLSQYIDVRDFTLTDTLPDGLNYILNSSSIDPDSITSNADGTSSIVWNIGDLTPSSEGTLTFQSITSSRYADNSNVASTDTFTNSINFSAINNANNIGLSGMAQFSLFVISPTLTKEVLGYFDSNLNPKPFDTATIGDFVRFRITYDSTNISAVQRDVELFDYPPYQMLVSTPPSDVVFTGDVPSGLSFEVVPDNGLLLDLGDLGANSLFSVEFSLEVNDNIESSFIDNLAKINIKDIKDFSNSIRDYVPVAFGIPNLKVSTDLIGDNCIAINDNFTLSVSVTNNFNNLLLADAYNLTLTSTLPDIYTIDSVPVVSGDGTYGSIDVNNNVLTLDISKLPANGEILITAPISINNSPVMSKPYNVISTITNGTSQQDSNSYEYTYNPNPLSNSKNIRGCRPTINKIYINNSVYLGDYYDTVINVTIPEGVIAYNSKITDFFFTESSQFLSDLTLNDESVSYSLNNSNLEVLLPEVIDTSDGPLTYQLSYRNRVLTSNPIDFEDTNSYRASIKSTEAPDSSKVYTNSNSPSFTIFTPGLSIRKTQKNVTNNEDFDTNPIVGKDLDEIQYKIVVQNIGKAPAYDISISDLIDEAFLFKGSTLDGEFNRDNSTFSSEISILNPGESIEFFINTLILSDIKSIIATNLVSSDYKANVEFTDSYESLTSNVVSVILQEVSIDKLQKNLDSNGNFTKYQIKVLENNRIQYKTSITNNSSFEIRDISISDVFPSQFNFASFEPFDYGNLSVENNTVTATIDSIVPNSTVDFFYTVVLPSSTFTRYSSIATATFNYLNGVNDYSITSNRAYSISVALGKGFKIY